MKKEESTKIPAQFIKKTVGGASEEAYLASGEQFPRKLQAMLGPHGFSLAEMTGILDFGCGAGRYLSCLANITSANLYGCDLDAEMIEWCTTAYPQVSFHVSQEFPPTPFTAGQLDLLYAVSVLTHLDAIHQDAWLAEWHRILSPKGVALITFRSEKFLADRTDFPPEEHKKLLSTLYDDGICFHKNNYWKDQFPDFYQGTYHTEEYVRHHWSQWFDVMEIIHPSQSERSLPQSIAVLGPKP